MRYRTNYLMDSFLLTLNYNYKVGLFAMPHSLYEFSNSPIVLLKGCILLKEKCDEVPDNLADQEKTEIEYLENHFHPDFFVHNELNEMDHLKFGLECSTILASRLLSLFPTYRFKVLLTYNQQQITKDNAISVYAGSSVRFYTLRKNVFDLTEVDDLNKFKSEAILEIYT